MRGEQLEGEETDVRAERPSPRARGADSLTWESILRFARSAVKVSVDGGELTTAITKDAVTDLGLTPGSQVVALVKSTEVSLATV